jgi:hypothetical protein
MNTDFGTPSRCSTTGVTTAALLIVMLAMGVSTLLTPATPLPDTTAGAGATQVADSHRHGQVEKS